MLQSILPIGAFATTLTTLSLSLMEWRGVTTTNVYVANFFFIAAFGLVVTAQWELAIGNGLAYSVYSAFGEIPNIRNEILFSIEAQILIDDQDYSTRDMRQ